MFRNQNCFHPKNRQLRPLKNINKENFIVVPTGSRLSVISSKNILRCEANKTNCIFYLVDGEKIQVARSLKFYEEKLMEWNFIRVNKSKLVNIDQIKKYHEKMYSAFVLSDQSEIPIEQIKKEN